MSQHPHDLQQERELLEHFRQHSQGEPSAAVDALILEAARQAATTPPARLGFARRLHAWLFGAGSHTRWSVAFAGLATLGLGLSLTWRAQEQLPAAYDMPAPVAAQVPEMAQESRREFSELARGKVEAESEKKAMVQESMAGAASLPASPPAAALQQRVATLADAASSSAEERAAPEPVARSQASVRGRSMGLAEEPVPLEQQLREVLRLRREGRGEEAEHLLALLRQSHAEEALERSLRRLQEQPAVSP